MTKIDRWVKSIPKDPNLTKAEQSAQIAQITGMLPKYSGKDQKFYISWLPKFRRKREENETSVPVSSLGADGMAMVYGIM